jgi:putative urate catabolism protein
MTPGYPRDLVGYGPNPPRVRWPGGARIALQFVLNYEEGAENSILHGDAASEAFLSEIVAAQPIPGMRHISMESLYEYGSRSGVWRLLRLFAKYDVPLTVFGVAMAMERNPAAVEAFLAAGHEIASHGWRWINYQHVPLETEREHMQRAIEVHRRLTGERPLGWYTGRTSPNTRRLVVEEGGFVYDADDYSDDLPFYDASHGRPQLVVPYTLDANDMRFATPQGFNSGEQFFQYLKDGFDALYDEGRTAPKMMSVGLHCRLVGRPGRIRALERFLKYVTAKPKVWCARRIEIARHWLKHHPYGERQARAAAATAAPRSRR